MSTDAEQGRVTSFPAATSEDRLDDHPASPLHAAVLSRQRDRVREILTTNQWSSLNLFRRCLPMINRHPMMMKMDNGGMCAIHVAVKLGYCDIIDEFLSLMPECVNIRSKDYKTALHIAVEHNQLEVVQKLLANQKLEDGRKMVSYDHDEDGNTAFHIAAKEKVRSQIVKELLRWPAVNVNAINEEGATPLDIIALHSARTARRKNSRAVRIKEILEEVGACRSNSLQSQKDNKNKSQQVDTLVASLIATVTFAAIFQVPGGIEDGKEAQGGKSPIQLGAAKLALHPYFKLFLFCDILAFFTSLTVVAAWLFRERLQQNGNRLQYLSLWSLGISVACSSISFLCAALLVVIPPQVKNIKTTHEKEFGEYEGLFVIMDLSVALPLGISVPAMLYCFLSDSISGRLRIRPHKGHYIKICVFIIGSGVLATIVMGVFECFGAKALGKTCVHYLVPIWNYV